MLFSLGIVLLFGSNYIKLAGAGALAVLTAAFVAAHGWANYGKVLLGSWCVPVLQTDNSQHLKSLSMAITIDSSLIGEAISSSPSKNTNTFYWLSTNLYSYCGRFSLSLLQPI